MSPVLACRGLTLEVAGRPLLEPGLDLDLAAGECLVILGRNGVGKTSLLTALAGLRPPRSGEIRLHGRTYADLGPRAAARLRALLPQHQGDAFPATVRETVLAGRHPHLSRWRWEGARDHEIARDALAALDLAGFEDRDLATLSGGERQRVALAALLAQTPRLACLDEPLAHLDAGYQVALLHLLRERAERDGLALAIVLHDLTLAARVADQALLLHGDGEYLLGRAGAVLNAAQLSRLFGHPLHETASPDGPGWLPAWGVRNNPEKTET